MSKFDMGGIANTLKKRFEKSDPRRARKVGTGNSLRSLTEKDFIKMPEWWQAGTNTLGLPFGKIVMLAGDSDSGKTSAAIEAMKAALAQDVGVIYVETEGKTTPQDLLNWGVDPDQIILVQASIAEEAFQLMFDAWDAFKDKYPDAPLLVIYDSLGNQVSMRDAEIDLTEQKSKPGGKGAINRLAINKMVAKKEEDNAAIFFVNYTYDNMGSPGKTNAGGKAVNFFSSLTYQTSRKKWVEATKKGKKVRLGAEVVWKLYKNHINKAEPGLKEINLRITSEGIKLLDGEDSQEDE